MVVCARVAENTYRREYEPEIAMPAMTVSGDRYELDRRDVEAALQGLLPEQIGEHFVVINGRRAAQAGPSPADWAGPGRFQRFSGSSRHDQAWTYRCESNKVYGRHVRSVEELSSSGLSADKGRCA